MIILLYSFSTNAQSLTDVARCKTITWLGVNFSLATFIGFSNNELFEKIPDEWTFTFCNNNHINFSSPNPLQQKDFLTYSNDNPNFIKRAFRKKQLIISTSETAMRNSLINCKQQISSVVYFLDIDKIKKVVSEYNLDKNGFGVLFIVESIEKVSNGIFIWVVYINTNNKEIISTKRYNGDFKNFLFLKKSIRSIIKLSGLDLRHYKN